MVFDHPLSDDDRNSARLRTAPLTLDNLSGSVSLNRNQCFETMSSFVPGFLSGPDETSLKRPPPLDLYINFFFHGSFS